MRRSKRLTWPQFLAWTALGAGTGLVAGFALGEWVGGVTGRRVRRGVEHLRHAEPPRLTPAATARSVREALAAEPRLAGLSLEVLPAGRGCVELRGWSPSRATRTIALRVARAVPGVEGVINRILVRGEDDRAVPGDLEIADESA